MVAAAENDNDLINNDNEDEDHNDTDDEDDDRYRHYCHTLATKIPSMCKTNWIVNPTSVRIV